MNNKYEFIININSSTISLTGVFFNKKNFGRCFYKKYEHGGFIDAFFAEPERLFIAVQQLVGACSNALNRELSRVYVILPQIFYKNKIITKSLPIKEGLVNRFDVNELMNLSKEEIDGCVHSECVPIAFKVANGYVDNPIDFLASTLTLISSSIALTKRVQEFFDDLGKRLNITFETMPLSKPLLNKIQESFNTQRSSRSILNFNEDYIDVLYCEMRAMVAEKTVPISENIIKGALMEAYSIDEIQADELLGHIQLNVSQGTYLISGQELYQFDIVKTNNIVKDVFDKMVEKIKTALDELTDGVNMPIYLTGNKLVEIHGFDSYLESKLGAAVQVLHSDLLIWNQPEDYALVGLIEMIINE